MKMNKIKLFYMYGSYEVIIKIFGDGTNVKDAIREATKWCEENCELIDGVHCYSGHKLHAETCE